MWSWCSCNRLIYSSKKSGCCLLSGDCKSDFIFTWAVDLQFQNALSAERKKNKALAFPYTETDWSVYETLPVSSMNECTHVNVCSAWILKSMCVRIYFIVAICISDSIISLTDLSLSSNNFRVQVLYIK